MKTTLVKFNQAVRLPPGKGGKDYSRGTHPVPDDAMGSTFFHKLMKAGLVEDGEKAKANALIPLQERQKRLAAKLAAPKPAPVAAPKVEDKPADEAPKVEEAKAPEAPAPVAAAPKKGGSKKQAAPKKGQAKQEGVAEASLQ